MNNIDQTSQLLTMLLIGFFIILFILVIVYIVLKMKEKKQESNENKKSEEINENEKNVKSTSEGKKSIFDFMEFDKIEDNMIIQKDGARCIMVIECQGINYDLMSSLEKTGVEEGFVQFLNTLRHPIQIYVQTRTINLEDSINTYKKKVNEIESNLNRLKQTYDQMLESNQYTQEDLNKVFFEITKQNNLYEYGKDIIYNTEKMSLNKNILSKKYYIVIAYHTSELGKNEYDKSELQSMAFSELYNRAQSIIRTISACSINAKILNSTELAELLYVAYNRDESETFDLKKAIKAEYDSLYSTAPDVLEKRMKELDKIIEEKAVDKVRDKIEKYNSTYREKVEQKEASIEELADEMAKIILQENKKYLGEELVNGILEEDEKNENRKEKTKSKSRNAK